MFTPVHKCSQSGGDQRSLGPREKKGSYTWKPGERSAGEHTPYPRQLRVHMYSSWHERCSHVFTSVHKCSQSGGGQRSLGPGEGKGGFPHLERVAMATGLQVNKLVVHRGQTQVGGVQVKLTPLKTKHSPD